MKKKLIYLFSLATVCLLIFYLSSIFFATAFLSSNHLRIGDPPENFQAEKVSFKTGDGLTLKGWYSKVSDSSKVIILLHGYKANRLEMIPKAELFRNMGYDVLLYDARGCGESEGDMVSLGYYEKEDLIAAVNFLNGMGKNDIAVYGFSQGGATAILASEDLTGVRCIISEVTFDNLENAIDNRFRKYLFIPGYLGTFFMREEAEKKLGISIDEIQPIDKIKNIKVPIFIIGGEDDSRTVLKNTMDLFNAANEPKELWISPDSEHENIYEKNPLMFESKIKEFLKKYL
jgi:dipeptidyl aminopeptidase/acylaminoacyl peptidase